MPLGPARALAAALPVEPCSGRCNAAARPGQTLTSPPGVAVVTNRAGQLEATVQQINSIIEAEKCTVRRLFRPERG